MKQSPDSAYTMAIQSILQLNRRFRNYSKKIHEEGITGRQLATLKYLNETGDHTAGELARYLFIGDSSMSVQLRKLKEKGYITKVRSETDNRVVTVSITQKGKKLVRSMPVGGILMLREKLKELKPAELSKIHDAIERLNNLMENQ